MTNPAGSPRLVVPFEAVGLEAIAEVGGKNASLGEMISALGEAGVSVPGGFATTAAAYRQFIAANGLQEQLHAILDQLDGGDIAALQAAGVAARSLLLNASLPPDLEGAIVAAYRQLGSPAVAVRSSATAEDLPDASFAGQQETYL
ncbi:MAG: phosphoenolpyruvate synthase, partial [Synechococcaceae bacterium WB8_1B_136]|nr:phosphoenolpyruvate synthase [Synechococcaceae bacterium WB8_1B_136]